MDSQDAVKALADFRHHFDDAMRQIAAIGIAQAQNIRAGLFSGF